MSVSAVPVSSIQYINGDLDVRTGYLGDSVLMTGITANISLVPGVTTPTLTKYYNNYVIQTNSAISVTLPTTADVSVGWYCRIDMISSTGAGSINVLDGVTLIARLNSNASLGQTESSVIMTLIDNTPTWVPLYTLPTKGTATQLPVMTSAGVLLRSRILAIFFSFCDVAGGAVIDVNTIVDVALRWINPNGQFMDTTYYTVGSNTRITALVAGAYRFSGIIGISNVGGATQTNLRIRPRLNGITFLTSFSVITSTILPFTNGVYMFDGIFNLNGGDYIEIMVGKSATSIGTNPVDLANTSMSVTLVSQQ